MWFGIVIVLAGVILAVSYKYLSWYFDYWEKRNVRGPKPKILKGNFEKTLAGTSNFVEDLHDIYMKYKSSERFVGIFTARRPQLFILDPALALQILTTHFGSFRTNEASMWTTKKLDRLRFASPMVNTGDAWTKARSDIIPALSVARLRSMYPAMMTATNKLSDFIESHFDDVDVQEISRKFSVELVSDFVWGITADTLNTEKPSPICQLANSMHSQVNKCVDYYRETLAWPWLRKLRSIRFFSASSDAFLTQITKDAAKVHLSSQCNRQDVLSHLLQVHGKRPLAEDQMVGYATTIFLNGFEIAGTVLAHCILMLARNHQAQAKLREELLGNLDDSGSVSFNRLHDLPYLDQCVQETLRLFPPVAVLTKVCTSPIELENSDGSKVLLRPGDMAYISTYSFHRDEDFFEKAEEFIPERFDPEVGGAQRYRKMGVFLPFGDGPRMCLGMKLGLTEVKIAIAEVVQKFTISMAAPTREDNQVDPSHFLLLLKGGIHLNFKSLK